MPQNQTPKNPSQNVTTAKSQANIEIHVVNSGERNKKLSAGKLRLAIIVKLIVYINNDNINKINNENNMYNSNSGQRKSNLEQQKSNNSNVNNINKWKETKNSPPTLWDLWRNEPFRRKMLFWSQCSI